MTREEINDLTRRIEACVKECRGLDVDDIFDCHLNATFGCITVMRSCGGPISLAVVLKPGGTAFFEFVPRGREIMWRYERNEPDSGSVQLYFTDALLMILARVNENAKREESK